MAEIRRKEVRRARKIRYTDAEWSVIAECARAAGRPPARYVREISLGAVPRAPRTQVDGELIHELGRIGTTLNRIASVCGRSDGASISAALDATLAELLTVVRRLG